MHIFGPDENVHSPFAEVGASDAGVCSCACACAGDCDGVCSSDEDFSSVGEEAVVVEREARLARAGSSQRSGLNSSASAPQISGSRLAALSPIVMDVPLGTLICESIPFPSARGTGRESGMTSSCSATRNNAGAAGTIRKVSFTTALR